jgi:cell division control protein 11
VFRLREVDIEVMQRLGKRVNIIPVIAKADSLSAKELQTFKRRINEDLEYYKIPTFGFQSTADEDDTEIIAENKELKALLPFAIVGSEGIFVTNNKRVRGRQYPWGIVEVDNTEHNDFPRLRYVLLASHFLDLKDLTHDELYENYRTQKLIQEERQISHDHSREMSQNPELREEVAKQVLIKEELLRKEEEKLREMELKVQRGNYLT